MEMRTDRTSRPVAGRSLGDACHDRAPAL